MHESYNTTRRRPISTSLLCSHSCQSPTTNVRNKATETYVCCQAHVGIYNTESEQFQSSEGKVSLHTRVKKLELAFCCVYISEKHLKYFLSFLVSFLYLLIAKHREIRQEKDDRFFSFFYRLTNLVFNFSVQQTRIDLFENFNKSLLRLITYISYIFIEFMCFCSCFC